MAKRESTFLNMLLALSIVTFSASAALGIAYEATKGPIAQANLNKKIGAIKQVVPAFNNDPLKEESILNVDGGEIIIYPAKQDGRLVGTAILTFSNRGYGGKIRLMVGLLPDGTIYNTAVLSQQETPGLGQKIESGKSNFSEQFNGKNPTTFELAVKQDNGDVDAITAATISSRAFSDAVKRAYEAWRRQ